MRNELKGSESEAGGSVREETKAQVGEWALLRTTWRGVGRARVGSGGPRQH